jgi:hypothetical protein
MAIVSGKVKIESGPDGYRLLVGDVASEVTDYGETATVETDDCTYTAQVDIPGGEGTTVEYEVTMSVEDVEVVDVEGFDGEEDEDEDDEEVEVEV